jgi:pimeloyl-ACP methyl ester carboxylesterase
MQYATSTDGARIAYEQGGGGPHLLLVHGSVLNRARWATIRPRFEKHFTVSAMDRRGYGESGDHPAYAIEREFEDIVAVVDALGAPVLLFGHSFGALCALEAAMRTDRLAGLVLYEPFIGEGEGFCTPEQLQHLDDLLAAGDRDGVVRAFMAEVMGMAPQQIEALRSAPAWANRVAAAHTIPREHRAEERYRLPVERAARLSTPTLLLQGGDSLPVFAAVTARLQSVLPNARTVVLPCQQHMAMETAPDLVVSAVVDFRRPALTSASVRQRERIAVRVLAAAQIEPVLARHLAHLRPARDQRCARRRHVLDVELQLGRVRAGLAAPAMQRDLAGAGIERLPALVVGLEPQSQHVAIERDHPVHVGGEQDDTG